MDEQLTMRRLIILAAFALYSAFATAQILPGIIAGSFPAAAGCSVSLAQDGATVKAGLNGGTSLPVTITSTAAGNRLIVCGVGLRGGTTPTVSGVSGSTLGAFTKAADVHSAAQSAYVWIKWATSALSSEVVTATASESTNGDIFCTAWSGGRDQTALTPGVDYATGTAGPTTSGTVAKAITTIASSGSLIFQAGTSFTSSLTITADANSTVNDQDNTLTGSGTQWIIQSNTTLAAGSHSVGGTLTSSSWEVGEIELLCTP